MNKVLITGINGFTGKHLSNFLAEKSFSVFGTQLNNSNTAENIFTCDITHLETLKEVVSNIQPDYVIHVAGVANVAHSESKDHFLVNTVGTDNLLKALSQRNKKPKKVILASSSGVYGAQTKHHEVLDETLEPQPENIYGVSKLAMEYLVRLYPELNIIVVRPFNYTGPGQSENFLMPKIVKHYAEEMPTIELGNLDIEREFNDIGFACEVYSRLLTADVNKGTFNLCSGRVVHLQKIIELMNAISGYEIEVKVNPKFVRKNEIFRLTGNPQKLFSAIGSVDQISFEHMLKNMYGYYKSR